MKNKTIGRGLAFFAALPLLMAMPSGACAEGIEVLLNGDTVGSAVIQNEDVYVPLRAVVQGTNGKYSADNEPISCSLEWNAAQKASSLAVGDSKTLFSPKLQNAIIKNGAMYVDMYALGKALNAGVFYDAEGGSVSINTLEKYAADKLELQAIDENSSFDIRLNSLMPQNTNYVISPVSLKYCLAMAANGADEQAKAEILKALGKTDIKQYNKELNAFIESMQYTPVEYNMENEDGIESIVKENKGVSLNIANSVWLNRDNAGNIDFSGDFKNTVESRFSAFVQAVNNNNAAESINNWCSKNTNGKIDKIVDNSDFIAALVNAVYFNGKWADEFEAESTKKDTFTDADGKSQSIDFMNQTLVDADYYEDDNVQIVALDYRGSDVSMYFALSNAENVDFERYFDAMQGHRVKVSIPKFKSEFSLNAAEQLKELGISSAFDANNLHFPNMFSNGGNAAVSDVIQKAYICVDEEGTEAAAATALTMVGSMYMPDKIYEFKANKPFMYFVRDNKTGNILFSGRYAYAD